MASLNSSNPRVVVLHHEPGHLRPLGGWQFFEFCNDFLCAHVCSYPHDFIRGKRQIEIHGTATSQFGKLSISGTATLDRMLNLAFVNGLGEC